MADGLTDAVNEEHDRQKSSGLLKRAAKLVYSAGVATAVTALTVSTVGTVPILVGGAFGLGSFIGTAIKGGMPLDTMVNDALNSYSAITAVVYPMIVLGDVTFPVVNDIGVGVAGDMGGAIAKSAYALTAYLATFIGAFKGTHHLISHYGDPKGITESLKDNFWADYKRFAWIFAPSLVSAAVGVPNWYGLPAFAVNSLPAAAYQTYNPPGQPDEKKYTAPAPSPKPAPAPATTPATQPG
ncbi:MAG: hypothetical protein GXP63_07115 [DPANN group archaeon]|nr:hypothetical protein [DPANN group archaeon]